MATATEVLAKLSGMIADWQLYLDNLANWSGGTGTKPLQDAAGNQRQVKTPHELDRLHTSAINNLNAHMADIENAHANAQSAIASKNAAKASELKSKDWASKSSVVESGLHSSKTYASQSATSASQSLASKNAAKTSETNALNSKNAAATSASQALTYKNNSASSATLSQNWASKSGSAVSGSLWSSKHYSEVSKSHADRIMNAGHQFFQYDSNRTYRTGEVCYKNEGGNIVFYQMYAGPNKTCVNKDPSLAANRQSGWTSSTTPFWWVPYTGQMVGASFFWSKNVAPEFAVFELNQALNVAVYWRLAAAYPNLVSGGVIRTGDVLNRFVRNWNGSSNINTTQADAIRNISGGFTLHGSTDGGGSIIHGLNGAITAHMYNSSRYRSPIHLRADSGSSSCGGISFNAASTVPTSTENRPVNITKALCIHI